MIWMLGEIVEVIVGGGGGGVKGFIKIFIFDEFGNNFI